MKNILLAFGNKKIEEMIKPKIEATGRYKVVDVAAHRGVVKEKVENLRPDIVILNEAIPGGNVEIDTLIYEIRCNMPSVRLVVLMSSENLDILSKLIVYGVYDIIIGTRIELSKILDILDNPKTLKDVHQYQQGELPFSASRIMENIKEESQPSAEAVQPKKKKGLFGFGKKRDKKNISDNQPRSYEELPEDDLLAGEPQNQVINNHSFTSETEVVKQNTPNEETEEMKVEPETKPEEEKGVEEISESSTETVSDDIEEANPEVMPKPVLERDSEPVSIKEEINPVEAFSKNDFSAEGDPEMQETFDRLKNECMDLISQDASVEEKLEFLVKKRKTLFTKLADDKDCVWDLEKEIQQLENDLEKKRKESGNDIDPVLKKQLEDRAEELRAELEEIQGSSEFLTTKINFLTACKKLYLFIDETFPDEECESPELYAKVIDTWKREYGELSLTTDELRQEVIDLNAKIQDIQTEKNNTKQEVMTAKFSLSKAQEDKEEREGELAELKEKVETLEGELEELNNKKFSLRDKIDSLNCDINNAIAEIKELQSVVESPEKSTAADVIKKLNSEVQSLREENGILKNTQRTDEMEEQLKSSEKRIEALQKQISEMKIKEQSQPKVDTEQLEKLKIEKRNLQQENFELMQQVETLKAEGGDSSIEMSRKMQENASLKEKIEQLKQDNQKLSNSIEELKQFPVQPHYENLPETKVVIEGEVVSTESIPKPKKTLLPLGKKNSYAPPKIQERKIIGFLGGKGGVGNSYVALNVAALLAKSNKVLYIEFDNRSPLSSYLFEFENITNGLEQAVCSNGQNRFDKLKSSIIKPTNKNLPENMHFMVYSQMHLIDSEDSLDILSDYDALFRRLKIESEYEYIIVDFPANNNSATQELLDGKIYLDKMFITMDQNAHSIACTFMKLEKFKKISQRLVDDAKFIVNRFNPKAALNIISIADWIEIRPNQIYPLALNETAVLDSVCEGQLYSMIGDGYMPFKEITELC